MWRALVTSRTFWSPTIFLHAIASSIVSRVVPGVLETTVESLKNAVTGAEHRARIDLPSGKEFNVAEVASGTTKATGAVPLDFSNSHAHFADSVMTSKGIE